MKKTPALPKHHDGYANSLLRGVAILGVITLHFLASLHFIFQVGTFDGRVAIIIDQFCRFCVPLFVALSGFGFWQKYEKVEFKWWRFISTQAGKLLPLYFLASTVFYFTLWSIPSWQSLEIPRSLLFQILTGRADYDLYFVPMIFQLYLLFPVVRWISKKLPWISLAAAGIFQIWLYQLYNAPHPTPFITKYLLTDQQQYVWFFSWIFYYFLGMHLPKITRVIEQQKWLLLVCVVGVMTTFAWAVQQATHQMTMGVDPIIALRFTREPILYYDAFIIIALMSIAQMAGTKMRKITRPLCVLGKWSYTIYLFHTLVLRMLFALF